MSEIKKSYYAIIPANVRYDEKLIPNAKLLYGEITALCNEKGYCWASNDYFARLYGVSKVSIQNWLKSLEDGGYINREVRRKEGNKEIEARYIRILSGGSQENLVTPHQENLADNNTVINNTSNITLDKDTMSGKPDDVPIPYKEVVDYLNNKADRNYKHTTGKTKTLIKARWNEGFRTEDFKKVIDTKVDDWIGSGMSKYLRPDTLFGTKFEGYLNEFKPKRHEYKKQLDWE